MSAAIDVAVITGAGGAHLDSYFTGLAETVECGGVHVVDPSGASEELARAKLGAKLARFERNVEAVLGTSPPPLALVSVESVAAPPLIRAALEAGCHVAAEKPSCVRGADFAALVDLAQKKHRHLQLALGNRMRGSAQHARGLVRSGALGKLYGVELHIIADQTRLTKPAYHKTWFADKSRAGGGHLMWLGIHWIDLVMFISGAKIVEVAAFTGVVGGQPISVEDSAAVACRFDAGFFGTITSGYYLDKGYHSHIKIWGSHGWLELEPHGEVQLQWYSTKDGPTAAVRRYEGPYDTANYTPFVRNAVRSAMDLEPPMISPEEGLRALQTVFASYAAAATRTTQPVA